MCAKVDNMNEQVQQGQQYIIVLKVLDEASMPTPRVAREPEQETTYQGLMSGAGGANGEKPQLADRLADPRWQEPPAPSRPAASEGRPRTAPPWRGTRRPLRPGQGHRRPQPEHVPTPPGTLVIARPSGSTRRSAQSFHTVVPYPADGIRRCPSPAACRRE